MTYMEPFERYQAEKAVAEQKQKLRWSNEIVEDFQRVPRAPQESPIKRWWLEQQERPKI
jgi:hypothetical protein